MSVIRARDAGNVERGMQVLEAVLDRDARCDLALNAYALLLSEQLEGEHHRPQVPPQLVYMHKLKEQNARSARSKDERDSGKSTPPPSAAGNAGVVAPRAVRERTTKHMAQQEQEKQKVAAVRSAKLPELKAKRKGGPSPFDGYQGLDPEETLKGIESLSPAEQIKRLQAAAVNPALKHSSRTFSMGPYGRR